MEQKLEQRRKIAEKSIRKKVDNYHRFQKMSGQRLDKQASE